MAKAHQCDAIELAADPDALTAVEAAETGRPDPLQSPLDELTEPTTHLMPPVAGEPAASITHGCAPAPAADHWSAA